MALSRPVHNRFEHFGKQVGLQPLGPPGMTVVHEEIATSPSRPWCFQHALRKKPSRTPEEQAFIVTMHNTWKNGREMGRTDEPRAGAARDVHTVLRARTIDVPTWAACGSSPHKI